MRQSDQMLEFIDGTLGGQAEQELFEQLAAQPELRTELRDYVQIGEAVRADREAFTPPADVERRLLGGLGLLPLGTAAAGAGGASGAAAGGFAAASLLKGGLLPLLTGFLLGALLVGGGVWYALDGAEPSDSEIAVAATTGSPTDGSTVDPAWIEPASARDAGPSDAGDRDVVARDVVDARRATTRTPEYFGTGAAHAIPQVDAGPSATAMAAASVSGRPNRPVHSVRSVHPVHQPTAPTPRPVAPPRLERAVPVDASIDATTPTDFRSRGTSDRRSEPLASPDFSPRPLVFEREPVDRSPSIAIGYRRLLLNDPIVDNQARQAAAAGLDESFIAGGYYLVDERLQVGIETGRERYAQSFFYNREDSIVIEQRPLLGWGGLAARIETDLLPIPVGLGATLGFSQHGGPVARGLLSVNLLDIFPVVASNGRLSLPIGFEASSLVYTFNDQYFVSGNWGLSGGVQIGF